MSPASSYFWKNVPFLRLFLPLATGIIIQWYAPVPVMILANVMAFAIGTLAAFFFLPYFQRYRGEWLSGSSVFVAFTALGALLVWNEDIRNDPDWIGLYKTDSLLVFAVLQEPPVEKANSYKAEARVTSVIHQGTHKRTEGRIIIYFKKDSVPSGLNYGCRVAFTKPLQPVRNSGNPGSFDYARYCLFQGVTHQVFLSQDDYFLTGMNETSWSKRALFRLRDRVLSILRTNIRGKQELGLAEALLIGYKNDLDKTLVQSYSNTGVVHVIAISGLHIGLIYAMLLLILRPLGKRRSGRLLRTAMVITGLWTFSLLAGAQPSVLRSAVMFTCIAIGQLSGRKSSIYNTLSFSAFILLCYNPFWLWDAGFQLSYAAVLSIVVFMKPVYDLLFVKNRLLDMVWKLNAVTLSAQVLTVPVSIFHFHQFPNYFILTNIVAVPLSSAIVLGEILLCAVSFFPNLAIFLGHLLGWLIGVMNKYVTLVESLPFSLWEGMQVNVIQTIMLYLAIAFFAGVVLARNRRFISLFLASLTSFMILRGWSFYLCGMQNRVIVYNVPKHRAIDLYIGRSHVFIGDSQVVADRQLYDFHLKSARIMARTTGSLKDVPDCKSGFSLKGKNILLNHRLSGSGTGKQTVIDLLVISGSERVNLKRLCMGFKIKRIVFDASVPHGRIKYLEKECKKFGIFTHNVAEKGAFVMNLN